MKRAGLLGRGKKSLLEAFLMFIPFLDKNSVGFGQEVDVGSRYGSLLFANTMKMLGTTDEKLKNHLIFRLCQLHYLFLFPFVWLYLQLWPFTQRHIF